MAVNMPEPVRNRMKQDRLRREMKQKHEGSLYTPVGPKTIRLQPSIDNTSILKYQYRPSSTASSSGHSPRLSSTPRSPVPTAQRTNSAGRTKGASTQVTRSIGTQTSLQRAASAGTVREKPPAPDDRPGSSLSNRSVTYTSRSASCQPSRLYQNEDLRSAAKLNRPPSKVYLCQEERDRLSSAGRTKSPSRLDGSRVELPGFMKTNYYLHHEDLDMGQKQYIWGVARIYSVTQLMSLKQRQYQSLLDYEFNRRIQNKELKDHERVKEWKDYQRYCKFIKRYDQRIPRSKLNHVRSPCEEASHVHKHMIKGWTTDPHANEAYRPSSRTGSYRATQQQSSREYRPLSGQHDTSNEKESADDETEEYRLRLIVLPGKRGETGTDSETEQEEKERKKSTGEKEEMEEEESAQEDIANVAQGENDDGKDPYTETDAKEEYVQEPANDEQNYLK